MTSEPPMTPGVGKLFATNLRESLPKDHGEALSIFCSGALAGLSLEAAVHGARVLQHRQQQLCLGHSPGSFGVKWWISALRSPVGLKGPYQGAVGTLAAGSIWSGIFGSVYVPVRTAMDATAAPDQPGWGPAVAAAAGSVASSSVRVPKQVVKARMERHEFFCSLQAFERILVREGPGALYRGWARSVAKNMPFDAVLFLLYDTGKTRLRAERAAQQRQQQELPPPQQAPCSPHPQQPQTQAEQQCGGEQRAAGLGRNMAGATGAAGGALEPSSLAIEATTTAPAAPSYGLMDAAVVGGTAGALTGLLTSPLEVARLAMQKDGRRPVGSSKAAATEGPAAMPSERPGGSAGLPPTGQPTQSAKPAVPTSHVDAAGHPSHHLIGPAGGGGVRGGRGGHQTSAEILPQRAPGSCPVGGGGTRKPTALSMATTWRLASEMPPWMRTGASCQNHSRHSQLPYNQLPYNHGHDSQRLHHHRHAHALGLRGAVGCCVQVSFLTALGNAQTLAAPAAGGAASAGPGAAAMRSTTNGPQPLAPPHMDDPSGPGLRRDPNPDGVSRGLGRGSGVAVLTRLSAGAVASAATALGTTSARTSSPAATAMHVAWRSSSSTTAAAAGNTSGPDKAAATKPVTGRVAATTTTTTTSTTTTAFQPSSQMAHRGAPNSATASGLWRWWRRRGGPSIHGCSSIAGQYWRGVGGGIMSRVLWSALEGAVFFPSLEAAIPLCDWLFLGPTPASALAQEPEAAAAAGGEVAWGHPQGLLRHPAHPLHW